ncbi:hypothetical protein [Deinococcus ruber]|uniref:hypothetical protein n=1 Tax=Deinococcus ruber TaxID=1848197 RepID=UPI003571540D
METGTPIEVLRDRTATTLALWLQQHPGIELATRDRSTEYARGLSEGAPQAQQVPLIAGTSSRTSARHLSAKCNGIRTICVSHLLRRGSTWCSPSVQQLSSSLARRPSSEHVPSPRSSMPSFSRVNVSAPSSEPLMFTAQPSTTRFAVKDSSFGGVTPAHQAC